MRYKLLKLLSIHFRGSTDFLGRKDKYNVLKFTSFVFSGAMISPFVLCLQMLVFLCICSSASRADPGFLERGFICIKLWGIAFLILSYFT